jgi:6-phosphogluconolactonase (cycloisomerase 2 family)
MSDAVYSIRGKITQPAGSGPRHAALCGNTTVILHELSNTITSQRVPFLDQSGSDIISNLSIVPEDQAALQGAKFAAAEVLIPSRRKIFPSGLVYASNRNIGPNDDPRGDAITVLTIDEDGKLEIVNQFFTGLKQIQGMKFGGPDDRFLVVSGAAGDGGVVVFERVGNGTNFDRVASNKDIPNLTSFVWV